MAQFQVGGYVLMIEGIGTREDKASDGVHVGKAWWRQLIAAPLAVVCLWLVLRGIDWHEVARVLANASVLFIMLAIVLNFAAALLKCTKVGILVAPVARVRYRDLFAAEMVSVLIDTALPFRLHEFVRAYIVGRSSALSVAFVLGAEYVVKVIEVFLLTVLLVGFCHLYNLPGWMVTAVGGVSSAAAVALLCLLAVIRWPTLVTWPQRLLGHFRGEGAVRLGRALTDVLDGVSRTAVRPARLGLVLLVTCGEWALLAGALWAAGMAVGLALTVPETLGILAANHVAFAAPMSISGAIGIYEAALMLASVSLFGIQRETALGLVLIARLVLVVVGVFGGLAGLRMAHVSFRDMTKESLKTRTWGTGEQGNKG